MRRNVAGPQLTFRPGFVAHRLLSYQVNRRPLVAVVRPLFGALTTESGLRSFSLPLEVAILRAPKARVAGSGAEKHRSRC